MDVSRRTKGAHRLDRAIYGNRSAAVPDLLFFPVKYDYGYACIMGASKASHEETHRGPEEYTHAQ